MALILKLLLGIWMIVGYFAQVFPATVGFPDETFIDSMANVPPQEFKNTAKKTVQHLDEVLTGDGAGYIESAVIAVKPSAAAHQYQAEPDPGIDETVKRLLKTTSAVTKNFVNNMVKSSAGNPTDWKLIVTIVVSVFGGTIILAIIILSILACRHSMKKSKLKDDADQEKPYAATTTNAVRAFFNIRLLKLPRAKTKSNLRPESNLELNIRDNWRNCDPKGEDAHFSVIDMDQYGIQSRVPSSLYSRGLENPHYHHDDERPRS